jgi:hypothetical protein
MWAFPRFRYDPEESFPSQPNTHAKRITSLFIAIHGCGFYDGASYVDVTRIFLKQEAG